MLIHRTAARALPGRALPGRNLPSRALPPLDLPRDAVISDLTVRPGPR